MSMHAAERGSKFVEPNRPDSSRAEPSPSPVRRPTFVVAAAFLATWIAAIACSALYAAGGRNERQPNVVVILSDDQGWGDYGCMGHPTIQTPHLDKLASEGLFFTHGYVPFSLCRPSLATIVTGLHPHQHGIVGNDPPPGDARESMLPCIRRCRPLPAVLAEKGYVSFQSGKWWEGNFKEGGFTAGMTHGDPARKGRHGDLGLTIGREGLQPIFDFLKENRGKPFFLWYAPILPHSPHNPPKKYLDLYQGKEKSPSIAKYQAMCTWFDATCGELLQHLEEQKLAEDTIVVYLADNGWIQDPASAGSLLTSKRSPYDGGVRTPIFVRWPGKIRPARIDTPVSSVDVAPTILAACGIDAAEVYKDAPKSHRPPGTDLRAVAAGTPRKEAAIFGEIYTHDLRKHDDPAASLLFRWVRDGEWKLIVPENGGRVRDSKYPAVEMKQPALFHVSDDPEEKSDQAAARPEVVRALREKLDAWWTPSR